MILRRIHPATRYPADPRAVFILSLCIVVGLPLLAGQVEPDSLEDILPTWAVALWAVSLIAGCTITLAGMAKQSTNGIIAEQIGSVIVGFATIFYATAIVLTVGVSGSFSAAIILGWGLSCFWRWGQLQTLLTQGKRVIDEVRGS